LFVDFAIQTHNMDTKTEIKTIYNTFETEGWAKVFADQDNKKIELRTERWTQRCIETAYSEVAPSVMSWSVFSNSKFASLRKTWFETGDEERIQFAPRAVWCLMAEHARRLDVGAGTDEAYVLCCNE
jgi:hypothetical protein